MSQYYVNSESSGIVDVQTLTGNSGGAVPPTGGNINTLGTGSITVVGNPGTSTLTAQLTGLTNHDVLVGAGTATITSVSPSTAGFVLTSNGVAADPSFQAVSASGAITTITGNSGGAESPSAGNFNIVGTGSITVAGSANTETVQLTGLTNHNVLLGAGTATITNLAPSATAGVPLVSAGAAADPAFGTAVVAGGGTGATSFNINGVVISNTATTTPLASLTLTNGQVVIGNTAGAPAAATLTPGSGISISNAANSITIATSGAGLAWVDVTGASQTIAVNTGYQSNNAGTVTFTLPASATFGDVFRIVGLQGGWTLAQAANQQVKFGSSATTVGVTGSLTSTNAGDCIECLATNTSASTVWRVMSSIGNITVA